MGEGQVREEEGTVVVGCAAFVGAGGRRFSLLFGGERRQKKTVVCWRFRTIHLGG
jgi:hypothetical protein